MRVRPSKRIWAWLALLFTVPLLGLVATTTSASALPCNDAGSQSGGIYNGTWTKNVCADNGNTVGHIEVTYSSWTTGDGHEHVSYDMTVEVDGISGDHCVQAAMDWAPVGAAHADAQIMRNCYENSIRLMNVQSHDVDAACGAGVYCAPGAWWVQRLQISVYRPDNGTLYARACPADLAPRTDTDDECTGWNPNASWSSVAAKIRRKTNAGTPEENLPRYDLGNYEIRQIIDANN